MAEDGRRSQSRRISIPEGEVVDDGHVKQGGKQRAGTCNGGGIAEEDSHSQEVQKSTTIKHWQVVARGEKEDSTLQKKQVNGKLTRKKKAIWS
jgi:hypothetical protein